MFLENLHLENIIRFGLELDHYWKRTAVWVFLTMHAAWTASEMIPASGSHQNT